MKEFWPKIVEYIILHVPKAKFISSDLTYTRSLICKFVDVCLLNFEVTSEGPDQ